MADRLNLALIGAGRRARGAHLPVIPRLADTYNFIAVCDADESIVREVAAEYGVRGYTNIREMVEREELDVADVCIPGDGHHAVCAFLAEAGLNILVETPIAATLPMADITIEAARRNNVRLEVAENYYRAPMERFKSAVIAAGAIGPVSRIYRIFYEGGYHGMSILRLRAGGRPRSILGITHTTPVVPITDRMLRHHTEDRWIMGYLEFDNGTAATMIYSNVIHARSLGRGQTGISQIDGTEGTIVGDTIYVVPAEELEQGARGVPHEPRRVTRQINGEEVLERIEVELPGETIAWENPFVALGIGERQVAVADELLSIADAVTEDREPEYGAAQGRLDQEMNLAMQESALRKWQVIDFPLTGLTETEQEDHRQFREQYGCEPEEVDKLIDVFYPRR